MGNSPNIDPVQIENYLKEIRDAAAYRLKIIRIADKGGWSAVKEYEGASGLGDSREDDKKIAKALEEADRKRKTSAFKAVREKRARIGEGSMGSFGQPFRMGAPVPPAQGPGFGASGYGPGFFGYPRPPGSHSQVIGVDLALLGKAQIQVDVPPGQVTYDMPADNRGIMPVNALASHQRRSQKCYMEVAKSGRKYNFADVVSKSVIAYTDLHMCADTVGREIRAKAEN